MTIGQGNGNISRLAGSKERSNYACVPTRTLVKFKSLRARAVTSIVLDSFSVDERMRGDLER